MTEFQKMCNKIDSKMFERFEVNIHPSQECIQRAIYRLGCDWKLLQDFYYWCALKRQKNIEAIKNKTLNELWLMFYMWREHGKLWDGEKWVEETKLKR